MRKTLLTVLGLCACMNAQAALYNPDADRLQVNIPNLKGGVDVSGTIANITADYHNTDTVIIDPSAVDTHPNGTTDFINMPYDFAYGLMLGWKFQNTGNDIRFSGFTYDVDSSEMNTSPVASLWNALGNVDDPAFPHRTTRAVGTMSFKLDAYDLEVAQHVNLGCRAGIRLLAGVSYHKVKESARAGYAGVVGQRNDLAIDLKSDFDGVGPRLGMDFSYYLASNFGFVGHVSSALLIGSLDSSTFIQSGVTVLNINSSSHNITVPTAELRLGVDYSYCINPCQSVRAELGYCAKHYFDSVNEIHVINGFNNANYLNNLSSVSFDGVYFTLMGNL